MIDISRVTPMLACADASALRFPLLASPKIDGIRALIMNGVVMSRAKKPIRNNYVQALFGRSEYDGLDGELCVGPPTAPDLMQKTMAVTRIEGEPDVTFHVFDRWDQPTVPFDVRAVSIRSATPRVKILTQTLVCSQYELDVYEAENLALGYEGVMVRDPEGLYKYGRATQKSQGLTKVKRFVDSEALVIGVEERMHNDNAAETNELGRTKRSTHQAGLRPAGDMGALVCRTPAGVEFRIGTGFTAPDRVDIWKIHTRDYDTVKLDFVPPVVGRIVKYKSFVAAGVKDAPRFPSWLGWRHPDDM